MFKLWIDSYKKIWFSELETYLDDISNIHCCDINNGEEEQKYTMN